MDSKLRTTDNVKSEFKSFQNLSKQISMETQSFGICFLVNLTGFSITAGPVGITNKVDSP